MARKKYKWGYKKKGAKRAYSTREIMRMPENKFRKLKKIIF